MIFSFLLLHAKNKGVLPSSFFLLTFAPFLTKYSIIFSLSYSQAIINGVFPYIFYLFVFAP